MLFRIGAFRIGASKGSGDSSVGRARLKGAGIAQLAERPSEKPGTILARVRIPGVARDFLSLGAVSYTHLRAHETA